MGISWTELIVVALVALIVIGPKELPSALRALGRGIRVVRRTAQEFQMQVDQFLRESEIDELRRNVEDAVARNESMSKRDARRPAGEAGVTPSAPSAPGPAVEPPAKAAPKGPVGP